MRVDRSHAMHYRFYIQWRVGELQSQLNELLMNPAPLLCGWFDPNPFVEHVKGPEGGVKGDQEACYLTVVMFVPYLILMSSREQRSFMLSSHASL